MINGLPLFDKVSVRTALPVMSLSVTEGNCALTVLKAQVSSTKRVKTVFFIILNCLLLDDKEFIILRLQQAKIKQNILLCKKKNKKQ